MDWEKLLAPVRKRESTGRRSFFEQDFDRIIFSQPFRTLQDKTQVFPLPEDDFVHTRLTHSLEVSSVGRSLGRLTGESIIDRHPELKEKEYSPMDFGAIVASASLAHDVGNPPFGHSGEQAISEYFRNQKGHKFKEHVSDMEWEDLQNFEGNAQGFRILNSDSLRLTYPVLGAFTKYPRQSKIENVDTRKVSQKKYGFFQTEKSRFIEMVETLGVSSPYNDIASWNRHPLAFLVEAADDICYHIIDLEDGCTLGLVDESTTAEMLIEIVSDDFDAKKYGTIRTRKERIGILRALAINRLVNQTAQVFIENENEILNGNFEVPLVDLIPSGAAMQKIIAVSIDKLYNSKVVLEIEAAGFEVISGLMEIFSESMYSVHREKSKAHRMQTIWRLIPEDFKPGENENCSTYEILRYCIDYVSGMTDSYAISTFRKIKGISRPGF